MDEWLLIYRDENAYSVAELQEEIARLKVQVRNPFQSQTSGTRGYQRVSVLDLRRQLAAAVQALRERGGGTVDSGNLVADFSQVQP
jgi:hypothetical protein